MAGSGGISSVEIKANNKDLISALPDCLLHHILSFLPSTRDSIRTSVLSKRWLLQWSCVPVLIFNLNDGMSLESFSNFIEKALSVYNCSKIQKFVINSKRFYLDDLGSKLATWIQFAVARDVKELILEANGVDYSEAYHLPQFLFERTSFVKFRANCCAFTPEGNVSWGSLKALYLGYCYLPDNSIENVLNGCPVIECLELMHCEGLEDGGFYELVVASKFLKMLRIIATGDCTSIEICCPNLEKLELVYYGMECSSVKLKDLPPSVSVTLDLEDEIDPYDEPEVDFFKFVKEILLQVQHVKELSLGPWILTILSLGAARGEPHLSLNSKCLTVADPFSKIRVPGLAFLLLSCPMLEKLKMQLSGWGSFQPHGSVQVGKKFWELNKSSFSCLMSSLKTVEIEILSDVRSQKYGELLKFAKFVLKNARVLEKMVLIEQPGEEMDFVNEICQKLSGVRKSSPHAVVEVAWLPRAYMPSGREYEWNKIAY